MYHALICTAVITLLKNMPNPSDILLDKSVMASSHNLVMTTARDKWAVPEWIFKGKTENRATFQFCSCCVELECFTFRKISEMRSHFVRKKVENLRMEA